MLPRILAIAPLATALLGVGLLAGCAPREPLSVSEMYGFCLTEGRGRLCTWQKSFCQDLRRAASRDYSSRDECWRACRQVRDQYRLTMQDFGCATEYESGLDWCERYCTSNYE